jgi:hypothetical protein
MHDEKISGVAIAVVNIGQSAGVFLGLLIFGATVDGLLPKSPK